MPYSVPGCTVDRFCSSGLQTIAFAVASINMGWAEMILAGGAQHMTHIPMGTMSDPNPRLKEFTDPQMVSMGYTAEMVARKYGITREEQDQMAVESHAKAHEATQRGFLETRFCRLRRNAAGRRLDEENGRRARSGYPAHHTMESLAKLRACFH